jgi:hypothetical protein
MDAPQHGAARSAAMGPPYNSVDSWRCRICGYERYHRVSVPRKNGARYETSFYACSKCSVMFLNPAQWDMNGSAAVNIEAPPEVLTPMRRRR